MSKFKPMNVDLSLSEWKSLWDLQEMWEYNKVLHGFVRRVPTNDSSQDERVYWSGTRITSDGFLVVVRFLEPGSNWDPGNAGYNLHGEPVSAKLPVSRAVSSVTPKARKPRKGTAPSEFDIALF